MKTNFEVRNKEAEDSLKVVGDVLKKIVPKGMGFTFFLFDYGEGGNMFYMSTAERNDMIKSLEEFIEKQKNERK